MTRRLRRIGGIPRLPCDVQGLHRENLKGHLRQPRRQAAGRSLESIWHGQGSDNLFDCASEDEQIAVATGGRIKL